MSSSTNIRHKSPEFGTFKSVFANELICKSLKALHSNSFKCFDMQNFSSIPDIKIRISTQKVGSKAENQRNYVT